MGDDYASHSKIRLQGFEFNNKGTKLFLSWFGQNDSSAKLLEYTLSTPYDITSLQLVTTAGINMGTGTNTNVVNSAGIRFSANGKRLFVTSHAPGGTKRVTQISLTNAYDTSSFVSAMENRQGLKIACLEEIALSYNWINKKEIKEAINFYGNCLYSQYLRKLVQ